MAYARRVPTLIAGPVRVEAAGNRPKPIDKYACGRLRFTRAGGELDVTAGRAGLVAAGGWVRCSMPDPGGAGYTAVCLPAFASSVAHRDHD